MDNAILLFNELQQGKYKRIQQLIEERQEEGLFLDFKEIKETNIPGVQKDARKIYAKALSGFSNAAGGVIVWGVEGRAPEKGEPDVAISEKPIKHLKKFLTDLNSLISDAITPLNTGVQNIEIYLNDEPSKDEGFVVTYVPASERPPHRAMFQDNTYYIRAGDSFIMMEHFMLEDAFGKRVKPKLEIYCRLVKHPTSIASFHLLIGIKNVGKSMANYPALRVKVISGCNYSIETSSRTYININLKNVLQTEYKIKESGIFFAGGVSDCIHPNTYLEVTRLNPDKEWSDRESLIGLEMRNERIIFEYSIYAEGCPEETGTFKITAENIMDFLRV